MPLCFSILFIDFTANAFIMINRKTCIMTCNARKNVTKFLLFQFYNVFRIRQL